MSAMIEHFHFLRPFWLLTLLLLPLLLWAWRMSLRDADPWRRICDPALLQALRVGSGMQQGARAAPWLFSIGFVLLALALAGPAFQREPQQVVRLQSPLIVAVDLSDRMRASDLKPDRISRMRFKLADLLARRSEGQIALIAYAGDAFTVAPLTDDATSLMDLAAALSPDVMPLQGQRAERAINSAIDLLHDAGHTRGELLLMTDAADERSIAAAAKARSAGLELSVLGVGTAQGAPVPRARGGFVQDSMGSILIPKLDARALNALADAGGGRYAAMRADDADLRALGLLDARRNGPERREDEAGHQRWRDEGIWLILLVLPLAASAFRRGWLTSIALLAVLMTAPMPAEALEWRDLWERPDQRAWRSLQQGDAKAAREQAQDSALEGAAAYRDGDYAAAAQRFAERDDATAHYNRGNALARAGHYQEAIAAYDQALERQPDFADAHANRKAVQEWLEQQPPPQDQQRDQGDQGDSQDSPEDQEQGQSQDSQDEKNDSGEQGQSDSSSDADPQSQEQEDREGEGQEPSEQNQSGQEQSEDSRQGRNAQDQSAPDEAQAQQSEPQQAEQAEQHARDMQQALEQGSADAQQEGEQETQAQPRLSPEEAERQRAMDALLQRVPDDPGGLLRRKFQLEFQRRQEEQRR